MIAQPYILHALSPLHAGIGQSAELIDLPIARLKGSGIPYLPGSSIKGVLRDAAVPTTADIEAVFGPDINNANAHAGALVCTDARLLALPVRSFRGTFAFVTCPLLLALAARDLDTAVLVPELLPNQCIAGKTLSTDGVVYLEDLDLEARTDAPGFAEWQDRIAPVFGGDAAAQQIFRKRFAIVHDETMTFLWETATQLDQRVRIDPERRTVAGTALWLEESLPPETLLIGLLFGDRSRKPRHDMTPEQVLAVALPENERTLQFGGKSTVGRGRCRMVRL
jgi:CRISPR-associated protein Cmr4